MLSIKGARLFIKAQLYLEAIYEEVMLSMREA
jgi:hypothetical protein